MPTTRALKKAATDDRVISPHALVLYNVKTLKEDNLQNIDRQANSLYATPVCAQDTHFALKDTRATPLSLSLYLDMMTSAIS